MKKLAIIGAGAWGAKIIRTVSASPVMDLVAAVTSKSAHDIREIAPFDGTVHADYRSLGEQAGRLDGVIVATPPEGRETIVEFFLDLNIPVFAEKPLTLDASATHRLTERSRRTGTPLVEDFIHLYAWPYIAIRRHVASAKRIDIDSAGGNDGPCRNYSPVFDYGPHDLSMVLQIFRCRPRMVAAELVRRRSDSAFSTRVALDFGERGSAMLEIGNTFADKTRTFTCRAGGDEWLYDDRAADKLSRNDRAYTEPAEFQAASPLDLAVQCFIGNHSPYSADDHLWLIETVADVTAEITSQLQMGGHLSRQGKQPVAS